MHRQFRIIVVLSLLLVIVLPGLAQDGEGTGTIQIAQWAAEAEATSEYSSTDWSAAQATGAPDVLECGDDVKAWASETVSASDTLTVYFKQTVTPTQVNIYQTLAPGAITGIEIIPATGSYTIPIENSADGGTPCPGVLSIDLPEGLPESNGVAIHLNQTVVENWNEIDAVELVGNITGVPEDSMPSSIETGDYPMYAVWSPTTSRGPGLPDNSGPGTTGPGNATTESDGFDFGDEWGLTFTCDGETVTNGIEVTIVQQRSGSRYRVSAIGLNGFDPVLAVMDEYGGALCNDDNGDAAGYSANLPTTGQVQASRSSAQIVFDNDSRNAFENVSLVVGGHGGMAGEFVLIVEGMVSSELDGIGDPFAVYASPALLVSGVDPTAYMISVTTVFDPTVYLLDADYNILVDENGDNIVCDDAGNSSNCWGTSFDLSRSYVSRLQGELPGGPYDAMMTIPLEGSWGGYLNYTMGSYGGTYGDYVVVFHLGTAEQP